MPPKDGQNTKLPPIPPTHKLHKRPVPRPAIPSPYTNRSSPKVVYIRANTKYMSAVNRARKLLDLIAKREQSLHGLTDEQILHAGRVGSAKGVPDPKKLQKSFTKATASGSGEEVFLEGTGRAIQRVLQIALWFQQRVEYRVRVTTASKGVVDDVERRPDGADGDENKAQNGSDIDHDAMETDEPEVPETRIRMLSTVKVAIGWR